MNNIYITEEQVDKEEHFSKERIQALKPKYVNSQILDKISTRPTHSLYELMNWAKATFSSELGKNVPDLNCWINNKTIIDGQFLTFAETVGAKVECIIRDSVASWRSDFDNEHFILQGIFKVTYKKLSFLQCSLFHKGNQNEDEISYFVILDDSKAQDYISFRNSYETWILARDREQLEIQVIGGDSIPYERNLSWNDLFMPDELKNQIKGTIEGFLKSKPLYESKNIPWKRGILLFGEPGNGKTSCIRTIISNYDFKPVTVQNSASTNDDVITEAFAYAESQGPSLLYFEDLDTLLSQNISLSHFLNLMDGVASKDGIFVIATANDIGRLKQSVTDRPSRFDRKWEVPLPNPAMSLKYLKKWFGKSINDESLKKIVAKTYKNKFSYSYLKELYITSAYSAISSGRKTPNLKDLNFALNQLIVDKKKSADGFMSESYEEIGIK